jgi:hypothetical protein
MQAPIKGIPRISILNDKTTHFLRAEELSGNKELRRNR